MFTVYLLDDEEWLLDNLYSSIDWNKHNASIIGKNTSSIQAYKEIKYLNPNIVFIDIRMPEMTGIELIENLNKDSCQSVFVVITGHAEFEYIQKAMENNAVGYCLKPIDETEICRMLRKAQQAWEDKHLLRSLYRDVYHNNKETNNQTFHMIKEYIDANFYSHLTLKHIADELHLNASYIGNLFRKETGTTFSEYLAKLRLDYACKLLIKSDLSVNEVADRTGFNNYFYFARTFKKYIQMTPTQYREKQK